MGNRSTESFVPKENFASLGSGFTGPFLDKKVVYSSFGEVSGDIYDFAMDSSGGMGIFLGDATGHGVGAAFMTMMVQIGLDSAGPDATLPEMLNHLHQLVGERTQDRFVTAVYARVLPDGTLTFASAGHLPVMMAPRQGDIVVFDQRGGMPLGLLDPPLPFDEVSYQLTPGDKVFFYTDGITEWTDKAGEQYGMERLVATVAKQREQPVAKTVDNLIADLGNFSRGNPSGDDLTLIGIQYK